MATFKPRYSSPSKAQVRKEIQRLLDLSRKAEIKDDYENMVRLAEDAHQLSLLLPDLDR